MVNSEFLNGLNIEDAKEKIIKEVEKKGFGKRKTLFRLKDWEYLDKDTGAAQYQ